MNIFYLFRTAAAWMFFSCILCGCASLPDIRQATYGDLKLRADKGDRDAQFNLGYAYFHGNGARQDYLAALFWFRKAAELGHAESQHYVGYCYASGKGVTKDLPHAVSWYSKAAAQGYHYAEHDLGKCFYYGEGVAKDFDQAVSWFRASIVLNQSQMFMGVCHSCGEGVPKDEVEAYAYFVLSCIDSDVSPHIFPLQDVEFGRKNFSILKKRLNKDQIAAGLKRAEELQKQISGKAAYSGGAK